MADDNRPIDEPEGFEHRPVMLAEVVDLFAEVPAGLLVDATLGGAGHATALLAARPDVVLLGLDQDDAAIEAARVALAHFGDRATIRRARFDSLAGAVAEARAERGNVRTVGVLFDLGVSSPQLDRGERGFSYRNDGPLDMRMDRRRPLTADVVVNSYDEAELRRVLARFGEDRHARRIAAAIVAARPIATTAELAEIVRSAIPAPARRRGGHPATRSFQAIRIEVNEELSVLPDALDQAISVLAPGGRCLALTYHSGEDRIVKARFVDHEAGGCTCPAGLPCVCGAQPTVRILRRGGWTPTPDEVAANPRAASARLRAVEKLDLEEAA